MTTACPSIWMLPAVAGSTPKIARADVRPARTHQPSQAQDLPAAQFKADILKRSGPREILDLQNNLTWLHVLFGEQIRNGAPDHHADQIIAGHIFHGACVNVSTIP